MSNNDYEKPESLLIIPADITASQKQCLIIEIMSRIRATTSIIGSAVMTTGDVPVLDISNTLFDMEKQLEQLENIIRFEVKADQHG